jgi:hypothetical protein
MAGIACVGSTRAGTRPRPGIGQVERHRGRRRIAENRKEMTDEVLRLARILWDYSQVPQEPIPAEVIVALGTNDLRVAEHAADLLLRGYGSRLVCTGGVAHQNDLLATSWEKTEAEMFADVAVRCGVPCDRILLETQAANTAENIVFTRRLLEEAGIRPRNVIFATKPFVQRRVWAALPLKWPNMPATLSSTRMTLDEYFTPDLPAEKVINIMMGDVQRIWVYGRRGWSVPQPVSPEVSAAFHRLVELGFTKQLIVDE